MLTMKLDLLPARGLVLVLLLLLCVCVCISPGAGIAGSLSEKLFMRLDRRRSRLEVLRAGDEEPGERCKPALIVAAAWRLDKEGDRGEGGPGCDVLSGAVRETRRGRLVEEASGEVGERDDVGMELMSGDMVGV